MPNSKEIPASEDLPSGGSRRRHDTAVLFFGRMSPEKGCHVPLDAYASVLEQLPDARLRIAGGEAVVPIDFHVLMSSDRRTRDLAKWHRKRYMAAIRDIASSLGERVTLADWVVHENIVDEFSAAHIFVWPSVWQEPFGMPVVEAMAAGLPVVAGRSGGISESVEHGVTGRLVPRDDPHALAAAIVALLRDPARAKATGVAGRRRAAERFAWDVVARQADRAYAALG